MNLITALSNLKTTAEGCSSDFAVGYLMAIKHAIELAEVAEGCSSDFAVGYLMASKHAIELAEVIECMIR